MRQIVAIAALASGLVLSPLAMAEPPAGKHDHFKGDITKADFLKKMEERFDKMDTNKDGVLSEAERKAAHEKMRSEREQRRNERMASQPMAK